MHMTYLEAMDKMAMAAGSHINRLVRVMGYHGTITYVVKGSLDPTLCLVIRQCGCVHSSDKLLKSYVFRTIDIRALLASQESGHAVERDWLEFWATL